MIETSVIIVTRNEENYILDCVRSIEKQFSNNDRWELIIVDGISEDDSVKIIEKYLKSAKYKYIILNNPQKILASGWNIGIKSANGKYIIRPDAHSSLHHGYISYGIKILENKSDVTAVGGVLITKSKSFAGNIIKEALSLKVGVGNSSFRTAKKSGYYDTAVFAIYRKKVFDKVGYFNELLVRHQDNEMHGRISAIGGKFYLCHKMIANYYCRDSFKKLFIQMFNIGKYLPYIMRKGGLSIRHYAPFSFLFLIGFLFLFSFYNGYISFFFNVVVFIYIFTVSLSVILHSLHKKSFYVLMNIVLIPMIHFSYGMGTFVGLFKVFRGRILSKYNFLK